ncbi:MAG: cytochrome P450 [Actinophytocola sp.]|uniref:cytochrome P450 n=1 Tax=Actinophytocola sp. TaxID=1872138 RepID=UPI003D6A9B9C
MTTTPDLPALGSACPHVGRLSDMMRGLQETAPVCRVRTPAGDEAWLVTRHAELKQLLLDDRITKAHPDPDTMPRYLDSPLLDMTVQRDHATAKRIHNRMREMLTPHFSARRMAALRPRVAERVGAALDAIVHEGPPADLHAQLTVPVSFHVLCDLLGMADRETFMALLAAPTTVGSEAADGAEGFPLFGFLADVVATKRALPADDLITALCESERDDHEVIAMIATVSFSYLVTPHNMSVGIALLANDPVQRDLVAADPDLLRTAVEEVLRMGKTGESLLPRYAREDIDIAGVTIRAGDLVLCDHYSASYDDRVFTDPDRFDVTRSPNPHPAFSHGSWYCVGAPLARIELTEVYRALLARLPGLRLEIPLSEINLAATNQLGGGIGELPVTW